MKKQLCIIATLCLLGNITHSQTWQWAKSAHGAFDDWGSSIAVDTWGNTFVAGRFTSVSVSFGTTTLTNTDTTNTGNTGMSVDIFLTKYDASGNFLWAKSVRGTDNMDERVFSVAIDASGNAYMAGMYSSPTLSFDSITLTNAGVENIFLAKYDANGNVIWAKSYGGSYHDWAYYVAVDVSGNIYMTGVFQSPTINFDTITLTNLDNTGNYTDMFLVKFDVNGNVVWAKSAGGTNYEWALAVSVDALGNAYQTGYFYSPTLALGSTTLTNNGFSDIFLTKYDINGNVVWARSTGSDNDDNANSIVVGTSGDIYIAGNFNSHTIAFGTTTLTNAGTCNIFIAKYDTNGTALWAKSAGGTETDLGYSVAVDPTGDAFITGAFFSPAITFDSITLNNSGFANIFLAKYNSVGNLLWAKSEGGTDNDGALSVAVDVSGNASITGWFRDVCSFGSTTLVNVDPVFGGSDLFIAKLDNTTGIDRLGNKLKILICPNPASDIFTVNCTYANIEDVEINIYNNFGKLVKSEMLTQNNAQINIGDFSNGVYIVAIKLKDLTEYQKLFIER